MFEDYKEEIATIGSVVTILQFFAGLPMCYVIVRKGKTGDVSGFPFVAGCLGCAMWLTYGLMLNDGPMTYCNIVGTTLQGAYAITYYLYANPKSVIRRQIVGSLIVYVVTFSYKVTADDYENAKYIVGLVCCLMTILFCAAPLTQLSMVLKTRSTASLPFGIIFFGFVVTFLWFLYGLAIHDPFVQVPNATGAVIAGLQLLLFVVFPSKHNKHVLADEKELLS